LDSKEWDIDFKFEDNGEIAYATTLLNDIPGIACVADIENARRTYAGKTLWTEESVWAYDKSTGSKDIVSTPSGYFPVQVVDVVPGWANSNPVRFVLQTPREEEGYIDVYVSGTNNSSPLDFEAFDQIFFTTYPAKSDVQRKRDTQ
jgi:hypothetical protein